MPWKINNTALTSRLLLGTARYPSPTILQKAIKAAGTQIITVSLRREMAVNNIQANGNNRFWSLIKASGCHLLPNTAGCRTANEAITTARMARELFNTSWLKLEVIGDDYTLQPNPFELVKAAATLINEGFTVLPYCTDDLILCRRLVDLGCKILMPWAAPIGSGQGIIHPQALKTLRQRFPDITLIVDAGIGVPSHAAQVMEMGFDAVLINSAVALASDPVQMAGAFKQSVEAGFDAYHAGLMPSRQFAVPSTPTLGQAFVKDKLSKEER